MPQHGIRPQKARIHCQERAQARSRVPDCRLPISIALLFLLLIVFLWSSSPAHAEDATATDFAATQAAVPLDQSSPATGASLPAATGSDTNVSAPVVSSAVAPTPAAGATSSDQDRAPGSAGPFSADAAPEAAVSSKAAIPAGATEPSTAASAATTAKPVPALPISATVDEDADSDGCPGCDLDLICKVGNPGVFWASQEDYLARLLSINYQLINNGPGIADDAVVTSATATASVTIASPLPDLGKLLPGESILFTLKWLIPSNVTNFTTSLTICTECSDPGKPEDPDDINPPSDPDDINPPSDPDDINPPSDPDDPIDNINIIPDPPLSGSRVPNQMAGPPLASASLPSMLPRTGFDLVAALIFSLALTATALLIAVPAAKVIRITRK